MGQSKSKGGGASSGNVSVVTPEQSLNNKQQNNASIKRGQSPARRKPSISSLDKSNSTKRSSRVSVRGDSSKRDSKISSASHPVAAAQRDIIIGCFESNHGDIGNRVYLRLFEKRPDFQDFFESYGRARCLEMGARLTVFLDVIVKEKLHDVEEITRVSKEFGETHVDLKQYGFKPDFWVTMADALTTECLYLDQAIHSPSETMEAWSGIIGLILGAVRDGYYQKLRTMRRNSRRLSSKSQATSNSGDTAAAAVAANQEPSSATPEETNTFTSLQRSRSPSRNTSSPSITAANDTGSSRVPGKSVTFDDSSTDTTPPPVLQRRVSATMKEVDGQDGKTNGRLPTTQTDL